MSDARRLYWAFITAAAILFVAAIIAGVTA